MNGTGTQNPIFQMMNSMQQNSNSGMNMSPSPLMPNMGQNMVNNSLMNNMMNSQMNNVGMMNSQMNNLGMMNNQVYSPMYNPMMMNNMNNTGNMMNMAQMSQQIQSQYQNQLQNMASNSQLQNSNFSTPANNNFMTLIFRASSATNDKPIKIQCTINDKISDVIERYRAKAQDNDKTKKFIFNAKEIDSTMTVGEAGLSEGSNIFVVTTQGVYGA